jgi:hypothetical protein
VETISSIVKVIAIVCATSLRNHGPSMTGNSWPDGRAKRMRSFCKARLSFGEAPSGQIEVAQPPIAHYTGTQPTPNGIVGGRATDSNHG